MRTTIGLTFLATLLASVSAANVIITGDNLGNTGGGLGDGMGSTPNTKATLGLMHGKCGSGSSFSSVSMSLSSGSKSSCKSVSQGFDSFNVGGQYFGYKIYSDTECTQLAKLSKEPTSPCYNVEGDKAYGYTYQAA